VMISMTPWKGCVLTSLVLVACASARPAAGQESNLYWGDTHLHTSYSVDAYRWGNVSAGPETAYRFARGLPVTHPTLLNRVRLDRALDFLVIADHSGPGLDIEDRVGVNPYKFGLQAGTDSHTSLSTPDEDNFWGKTVLDSSPEGGATQTPSPFGGNWDVVGWDYAAQGLTGAWASENTREALTAAFKRKEVYATSGPRIRLRMFGGFEFDADDTNARDIATVGYGGGVPMGGDLGQAPNGSPVSLLIHAVKDPVGANLDRVQVIKGWLDEAGDTNERVHDVE